MDGQNEEESPYYLYKLSVLLQQQIRQQTKTHSQLANVNTVASIFSQESISIKVIPHNALKTSKSCYLSCSFNHTILHQFHSFIPTNSPTHRY